jgi:hypothetical protein
MARRLLNTMRNCRAAIASPKLYEQWQILNDKCVALHNYRGLSGGGEIAIESEADAQTEGKAYQELQGSFCGMD